MAEDEIDVKPKLGNQSIEWLPFDDVKFETIKGDLHDGEQFPMIDPLDIVKLEKKSESDDDLDFSADNCDEDPSLLVVEGRKKRRSFTIQRKLQIILEYEKGISGRGFKSLAQKYEIATSTLQGWVQRKSELEAIVHEHDRGRSSKRRRRLPGGGQKPFYPELEDRLLDWVKQSNKDGIRVTDRLMLLQASNLAAELDIDGFKISNGWLDGFKRRQHLTSRDETTCSVQPQVLSTNALEKDSIELDDFHTTIKIEDEPQSILNMD
ncbi:tigger transposable element-derived protein 4-like [Sabethes cyaneus]|uniref:tigger transposable element-derived protein 4-like n=1 Tax=Sabethes cyaneus TaxID=53552 RepID=UPI00237DF814|nr:tigger transposable element-derived protein 4-like [Sabethes cyaneus]